jgi:uncharacterized protein (TIGR00369 family)
MPPPRTSGPFAKLLGVELVREDDQGSELWLDVREDHQREGAIVHGGVMMSLLDMAMAATVARTLKEGERTMSVTINTEFMRPFSSGRLIARARLERRGRTMGFPVGELTDAEGKMIARATGVWAIVDAKGAKEAKRAK